MTTADVGETKQHTPQDCPRGFHKVTVDANGRAKLPALYKRYIEGCPDQTLFFTFILGRPRIFTNGSFQKKIAGVPDKALKKEVKDQADAMGENLEFDGQGRITFPAEKRQGLGLESCTVWFRYDEDVISIYSDQEHEAFLEKTARERSAFEIRAQQGGFDL